MEIKLALCQPVGELEDSDHVGEHYDRAHSHCHHKEAGVMLEKTLECESDVRGEAILCLAESLRVQVHVYIVIEDGTDDEVYSEELGRKLEITC